MKTVQILFIVLCVYTIQLASLSEQKSSVPLCAITFTEGSRLGDKIKQYLRIKWLSYKYNIPLLLPSFTSAHMFTFFHEEQHFKLFMYNNFQKKVVLTDVLNNPPIYEPGTLYVIPWRCKIDTWDVMQRDTEFKHMMRLLLQPKHSVPLLNIPYNMPTVAMHIRKPSGHDKPLFSEQLYERLLPLSDQKWPGKFPPEQYYVDALRYLSELYYDVPLYVFIFTDDKNPQQLCSRIQQHVEKDNIIFSTYMGQDNDAYKPSMVADLYNMTRFDCVIKSTSHFSNIARYMHDFNLVITPKKIAWCENKLIVTKANVESFHQQEYKNTCVVLRDPSCGTVEQHILEGKRKERLILEYQLY